MMYFKNCKTLSELKSKYRELLKKYHPDNGGNVEIMKAINVEYREVFDYLKSGGSTEKYDTSNDNKETADDFIKIINELFKLQNDLIIELCGNWLYISGNTKPIKDKLKAMGCRWASKKKVWYWRPAREYKPGRRGKYTMQNIRDKYGSIQFTKNDQNTEYAIR